MNCYASPDGACIELDNHYDRLELMKRKTLEFKLRHLVRGM